MSELIITNIITSMSTLGAAAIGTYFMYKSNSNKKDYDKLVKNTYRYLQEIKSFYKLEQKYIEEIASLNSKKQGGIKKEMREKLDKKPSMTSNDVDRILKANRYVGVQND